MAQALYRKYRSKSLQEVVGQEHITDTLAKALQSGNTSHAYLFTGPRGVGKTSVARILAHELNQLPYSEAAQHLDIIEIDAASNRRIDDVRDLRDKVHIAPAKARYKVYIIDEVHMLTGESFNALLKTLEEPPAHVVFVLATTEVHKLPATIVSRVQRFHFRPVAHNKVVEHLQFIAQQESITIEPAALSLIAEHGEGSFRDSISLLDQLSAMSGGNITAEFVQQSLGLASSETIDSIVQLMITGDRKQLHDLLAELEEKGVNPLVLSTQLISAMKKAAPSRPELYAVINSLLDLNKSAQPATKLLVTLLQHIYNKEQTPHVTPPATKASAAQTAATTAHTVTAPVAAPPKTSSASTSRPAKTPAPKAADKPKAEAPTAAVGSGPALTDKHWPDVLAEIRRTNQPLFSMIKSAEPRFDGETLTLALSFKLHQIKLDDSRYRAKLVDCVTGLGYQCPAIVVVHDATAAAPAVAVAVDEAPAAPADETASSVLAMMGGGEMVNA